MIDYDKIDLYLTGRLPEAERTQFEQEMLEKPELAHEVAMQRDLIRAIQKKGAKEYLQNIERNIQHKARRARIFKIYIPAIAVAACLFIGVFFQIRLEQTCRNIGYGIPLEIEYGRDGNTLDSIIGLIETGDFKTALSLVQQERESSAHSFDLNTDEGRYLKHQTDIYMADLDWYEAIIYLRSGRYLAAKRCLKRIVSEQGYYSSMASDILSRM